jgi:hypothetical protein
MEGSAGKAPGDERTLEMRVAELEDKLAKIYLSEEQLAAGYAAPAATPPSAMAAPVAMAACVMAAPVVMAACVMAAPVAMAPCVMVTAPCMHVMKYCTPCGHDRGGHQPQIQFGFPFSGLGF